MCKIGKAKTDFDNRTTEITLEELRELDSFKNYDQQQANELIQTMKTFVLIIYNICANEDKENGCSGKTKAIEINNTEQLNKAA